MKHNFLLLEFEIQGCMLQTDQSVVTGEKAIWGGDDKKKTNQPKPKSQTYKLWIFDDHQWKCIRTCFWKLPMCCAGCTISTVELNLAFPEWGRVWVGKMVPWRYSFFCSVSVWAAFIRDNIYNCWSSGDGLKLHGRRDLSKYSLNTHYPKQS